MEDMISVIVPAHNCESYVGRCINSIIKQTYTSIECVIVDDGSNDNTLQICEEFAVKDNRIKVIHKQNGGVQAAREDAVRYCNGEYIMFVDADDYLLDSILEITLRELKSNDADIVCFDYISNGKKGFNILEHKVINRQTALKCMLTFKDLDGNLWCKLYKANMVKNLKFEEKRHCNFITCSAIIQRASRIAILPQVGYIYSVVVGSITHGNRYDSKIAEYESTTYDYYKSIIKENPELDLAAEFFWLRSLLWINIKMEKDSSLKRGDVFFKSKKNLLREKIMRFYSNPYFCIYDKLQVGLCYTNLFRMIYKIKSWINA